VERSSSGAAPHRPAEGKADRATRWLPLAIALLTAFAFAPVLRADFVTWDDDANFLLNPSYRGLGLEQLRWMFTTFHMGHYVPLTWMSHGLDYTLWGMHAAGYHAVNLALHCANAVLFFHVARRLLRAATNDQADIDIAAAVAALFFALHPLRVESVAWVTERRDVLSGLFFLSSVLFYLQWAERGERSRYVLAVGMFAAALLSKASVVTLPLVLLVISVYPLRRVRWLELIPFVLLSAGASLLSIIALHPPGQLSFAEKLAVSAYSIAFYVWKTLLPARLSPLYELPRSIGPLAPMYVVGYTVTLILFAAAWLLRRRFPGATAALAAFGVMILPFVGVVQNGPQITADRYTYLASLALALIIGGAYWWLSARRKTLAPVTAGGVLLALTACTWRQSLIWQTSERLWTRVVEIEPRSAIGNRNLGNVLLGEGLADAAIARYQRSLAGDSLSHETINALGTALAAKGDFAGAIALYQRALALEPRDSRALNNWGVAEASLGHTDAAIEKYRAALAIDSSYAEAEVNWGNALVRARQPGDALSHYERAVRLRNDNADARVNWGVALAQLGRLQEAAQQFRTALDADPSNADARTYLAETERLLRR